MNRITLTLILVVTALVGVSKNAWSADNLSSSEVLAIGAASVGVGLVGTLIREIPESKKPLIRGHLPFELSLQRWIGGEYSLKKKSNFLDSKSGGGATPLASGIALSVINLRYPRDSRGRDLSQDIFLFTSGALATKGITDIAKRIFARERPLVHVIGENVNAESMYKRSYLQHSFFSGHTSSAFFSASFLNLRIRETMRRRMTSSEYRSWRWVSSGALYGWASIVGLSRIQAYKHHPSDVLVGALAGVLVSELFFNFGNRSDASDNSSTPLQFRLTIPF